VVHNNRKWEIEDLMSNILSSFLKKRLLRKDQNLVSLENHYAVISRLLKNNSVRGILDAGASNGHISRRLLDLFPTAIAYAFEPNPLYRPILDDLALRDPRIRPQYCALSDHEGTDNLYITESPGNTSLLAPNETLRQLTPDGAQIKSTIPVEVLSIDAWAERNHVDSIELMKFDIQGGELKALHGAVKMLQTGTRLVYTEVWFNPSYSEGPVFSDIDFYLRDVGFVLYDLYKPKYGPDSMLLWANALYVRNRD
jgi:FkbM family methyltransferase